MVDTFLAKFEHGLKLSEQRHGALKNLKQEVSKKLVELSNVFTNFEAVQQPKLKNLPVFLQSARVYCDLVKPFLIELDKDIQHTVNAIESAQQAKEAKLKSLLEFLDYNV